MANENFTTYTETDPNAHISTTSTRVTFAGLHRAETAYLYTDKGAAHFSGNFTLLVTIHCEGAVDNGAVGLWAITNDLDDIGNLDASLLSHFRVQYNEGSANPGTLILVENDSGGLYGDSVFETTPFTRYLAITRDESIGTYGTLICKVYSDSARTILEGTISLTLHSSKKDFRYIFGVSSISGGTSSQISNGYIENFDLQGAAVTVPWHLFFNRGA